MQRTSKIFVAGGTGLVGSAILENLVKRGYRNLVASYHNRPPLANLQSDNTPVRWCRLDLMDAKVVEAFFAEEKPDFVFLAAAKVGGIVANNTYRAEFIYENLQIQNNVIHNAYKCGVKKLMFLGSTCIYPKNAPQPMKEEYLLTGELEYTNEPYAIAKIAGIKMCESYNLQYGTNFISVMPTNLYGPNDNFDLEKSHVLPALIRKMHLGAALERGDWQTIRRDLECLPVENIDGKADRKKILQVLARYGIVCLQNGVTVHIWGTGHPKREFMWSGDMADACIYLMEKIVFKTLVAQHTSSQIRNLHINIGTGHDISIHELASLIKKIVKFDGNLFYDHTKPDGAPRKVTDVDRLQSLGWRYKVDLEEGVRRLYNWYRKFISE